MPSLRSHRRLAAGIVATMVALTACDIGDGRTLDPPTAPLPAPTTTTLPAGAEPTLPPATPPPALQLTAPWQDGGPIDARHTCDDVDVSPALSWSGIPANTLEVAITVTDPDADGFIHWIVYGIDPTTTNLAEGALPAGAFEWVNDFGEMTWRGPCPPSGEEHRYDFTVHALSQQVEVAEDSPADEVLSFIELTSLARATTSATYFSA